MSNNLDLKFIQPFIIPVATAVLGFYVSTVTSSLSVNAKVEQLSKDIQTVNTTFNKFDERFSKLESSVERILLSSERANSRIDYIDQRVTALETKYNK